MLKEHEEKKGTKTVPLGHHFGKGCLFRLKGTILVPMGCQNKVVWNNSALLESGTKMIAQKGTVLWTIKQIILVLLFFVH